MYSFPPVVDAGTRILILGSMPGIASLDAQQYYAHPRNQFWRLMADIGVGDIGVGDIHGAGTGLSYPQRLQALLRHGLGLWDVLHSCVRGGSLDAAIEQRSAQPNDLLPLLRERPIMRLCCNGATAYTALQRHLGSTLASEFPHIDIRRLPSTSPAHASVHYARKLAVWAEALRS